MCGIIAHISKTKKSSSQAIVDQYQEQYSRGTRGFGLISIDDKKTVISRATEPVKALLDVYLSKAPIMVFHHRQPTSTDNTLRQTHPIVVSHDELKHDYHVVHNGVIRPSSVSKLFKKHTEELGYTYSTLVTGPSYSAVYGFHTYQAADKHNDSETLAIEVARYIEGLTPEIGTEGSAAFIVIQVNKKTGKALKMFWGRNDGNPLELLETPEGLLIASDIDNENAEIIPANTMESIDIAKYLSAKKKPNRIIDLIDTIDIAFVKPEPIVTHSHLPASTVVNNQIKAIKDRLQNNETQGPRESDPEPEPEDYMSPREIAFATMAERITEDIGDEIQELCQNMAYKELTDTQITEFGSRVMDILFEKEEIAKSKIRPHFDKREQEQTVMEDAAASWDKPSEVLFSSNRHAEDREDELSLLGM